MLLVMLIEDILADLGASVTVAASVDQAIALIEAQLFDAATLDLNLNGSHSYPVADSLAMRGVPFVFSTGYHQQGLRDGYRDRPVLRKPFKQQDLIDSVTRLLTD